ncbi:MAG: 4-hydroxy-tetrahydrodipicolinate reductase [Saprospiraceae bacterium]|nr:4-hydroxy-tetrahydrodipicolinate reductase [Saprospiraceae bacterium]MCB0627833.1 4-hydroxy-tetrahydrodipicolinate reductase [Saprospiraceae bacterium]MCB0678273.1 4-hydroxy-tetrahydrodipicolinate reductase [Saprospiraceae bacterium]MCB0679391.1 4-hydroxy-tetrahydrodipicolinate reductase [Saprospiraceae bacterium]
MNIALIGYGKMGKTIERLAVEQGHEIVLRVHSRNRDELTAENLRAADVAIEFSRPETAFRNIADCLKAGLPVVCGTTAWLDRLEEAIALCNENKGALLYASNFSIGVNLFFAVNQYLAFLMEQHPAYNPSLREIHHTEKLDAPSGTAISLANQILERLSRKTHWVNREEAAPDELSIVSVREDPAPGTHLVRYFSAVDSIEIQHVARSREGFASGALLAAAWLVGKKGFFGMRDVLGF